jgi:hypothetical protein
LNLPTPVEDSKLFDYPSDPSNPSGYFTTDPVGIKTGRLHILSRFLKLYTRDGIEVCIDYFNRTGTITITIEEHEQTASASVTAGWYYSNQETGDNINNISDCYWVISGGGD